MSKILKVLVYPQPLLREKAKPVTTFDSALKQLADDMSQTMYAHKGIGLAANQVGILKRIFILDTRWKEKFEDTKELDMRPEVFVNPEILAAEGEAEYEEGCLSIPQVYGLVTRPQAIKVRFNDITGSGFEQELSGLKAIAFQHELDHLNGVMFFDHLSPFKRRTLLEKYTKLQLDKDRDDD